MTLIRSEGSGDADLGFYNGVAEQSCKFVDGDGAYLQRTPSSAGNRKMWTTSMWYKRTEIGGSHYLFTNDSGSGNNDITALYFESDQLMTYYDTTGTNPYGAVGPTYFRDTNAWMHIVWAVDAANTEHKVWVNNVLVSTDTGKYPPNYSYNMNNTAIHRIGEAAWGLGSYDIDGYLSHFVHIDGQYLEPDSFAEEKEGVWIPKDTSGLTFGTNGFQLDFKQTGTGTASASTIGADTSGNDHHWTSVGLVSSDSNYSDCPENNWCILSDAYTANDDTLSEGNTHFTGVHNSLTVASFAMPSGKWYCEVRSQHGGNANTYIGVYPSEKGYVASSPWDFTRSINQGGGGYSADSTYDSAGTYGTWSSGDVLGMTYDSSNGQFKLYKDDGSGGSTLLGTITESAYVGKDIYFAVSNAIGAGGSMSGFFNFGQDGTFSNNETAQGNTDGNGVGNFFMPVPDGFLALCAKNLDEPTIGPNSATQADDHFKAIIYSGSSDDQTITTGMQPDLIWIKQRNSNGYHHWTDTNRGITYEIHSNATDTPTNYSRVASTSSTGFTFEDDNNTYTNSSGSTYVAWCWKGGTNSSNTEGSTTATVQANTTAGFSIVKYAGSSSSETVGHGLDSAPEMVIVKSLTDAERWCVFHTETSDAYLYLNESYLPETANADERFGNSTSVVVPSSTLITLGANNSDVNENGDDYIMYCFHSVVGYSKFGKYAGNGSTDGVFIWTGFKPKWIMVKSISGAVDNWAIYDSARDTYNPRDSYFYADDPQAEATYSTALVDFLSNGFKWRGAVNFGNNSSRTYAYAAFAEMPFKYGVGA